MSLIGETSWENPHREFLEKNVPFEIMKEEEIEWENDTKVVLPPVFLVFKKFRLKLIQRK